MGWSDIFYPDNPKRREELIRKSQQFQDLMESNFYATNELIDVMNEHLNCSFQHIELNEEASLQKNCNVMIECMHKIQAVVEKIDKELKEKLEPTLYEKLKVLNLSLPPEQLKGLLIAIKAVCGVEGLKATAVVSVLINNGDILANLVSKIGKIATGALASVGLAVVFLGIDMIFEAIAGSIERDKLEKALKEYEEALIEFKPASLKYQHNIMKVQVKIEKMKK
ncbi:single-pass membrane and coiled-coil domain-containing protein 3-like [Megalobrama amblycephala]|uniref:single-pass membrane and coiled-coil domain-containing protein 3-like n=1 Tax=Megalobrama amblycephala TaxID=75352 RepID=UPI002014332F|nr:single-pass membrane and coiled-coil domain-containing protein 3-like [Megalobrama amblycephala]